MVKTEGMFRAKTGHGQEGQHEMLQERYLEKEREKR